MKAYYCVVKTSVFTYAQTKIFISYDVKKFNINIFLNGRGIAAQGAIPPGIFGNIATTDSHNKYVYDWYYEIPTADEIEIDKLKLLEDKVTHLEKLLENK